MTVRPRCLPKHHADALAAIGIKPHGRLQRAEDCAIRIFRHQPDDPGRKIAKIPKAAADIGRLGGEPGRIGSIGRGQQRGASRIILRTCLPDCEVLGHAFLTAV